MKKWIWLFYLVTWTTIQAVENNMGYLGDAVVHYSGCHIDTPEKQQNFNTLDEAKKFIADHKDDRMNYGFQIFEVKEK